MKDIFIHNASVLKIIIAAFSITLLSGCADAIPIQYSKDIEPVGFWYGLWHGIIAPFSFIISLFSDKVAIYAVYNNGGWYNFGYLFGLSIILGGGSKASKKKRK
jgi:hypothetical protein